MNLSFLQTGIRFVKQVYKNILGNVFNVFHEVNVAFNELTFSNKLIKFPLVDEVIITHKITGNWCNGSTLDSGSSNWGSNP